MLDLKACVPLGTQVVVGLSWDATNLPHHQLHPGSTCPGCLKASLKLCALAINGPTGYYLLLEMPLPAAHSALCGSLSPQAPLLGPAQWT